MYIWFPGSDLFTPHKHTLSSAEKNFPKASTQEQRPGLRWADCRALQNNLRRNAEHLIQSEVARKPYDAQTNKQHKNKLRPCNKFTAVQTNVTPV